MSHIKTSINFKRQSYKQFNAVVYDFLQVGKFSFEDAVHLNLQL